MARPTDTLADPAGRLAALSPDMMGTASAGYFTWLNPAWERVLGWSADQMLAKPFISFVHPDDVQRTVGEVAWLMDPRNPPRLFENRYRTLDGGYRWLEWTTLAEDGVLYFIARDVASRHLLEEAQARAERLLYESQRLARIGSWEIDLISGRHRISEHLREMLCLASTTPDAGTFLDRVHEEDRGRVQGTMAAQAAGSPQAPEDYRVVLPDGTERLLHTRSELVWGARRLPVALHGTTQDVTEQRQAERLLARSEERFRQGFDKAPIPMTLTDLSSSRYVRVNAAYCEMVGCTEAELMDMDFYGVLHPDDIDPAEVQGLRDGVVTDTTVERRYLRPDGAVRWASAHLSRVLGPDGQLDVMFAQIVDVTATHLQADAAKRRLGAVSWIAEIRAALSEDRFVLHAQPIIDLASGEIVHHELLLRMNDSEGNLVSPDVFLPTAERYGAICDIDRWVVGRALELAAGGMNVCVNLSGMSLGEPDLIAHIDAELLRTGADPHRVVFEITETALVEAADTARVLSEQLRARGCRFALDDFGTGYGGFSYLKSLPLDILKVDREFVRDLVSSESDQLLIWTVISLARGFGMQTIAEGIEDQATLDLLCEMGIDHGQGYFIGRPAPIDTEGPGA